MKPGELDRAGGRESLKTGHGFYVYRGGRLVVPGGWFRIVPSDELIRLARVRVDIPVELDHLWRIDTEVLPLLWRQVDFAAGEVRIDDPRSTKNEQARVFPFTQDLRRAPLRAPAEADRGARLAIRVLPLGRRASGEAFQLQRVLQGVAAGRSSGRRRSRSARFQENRDQKSRARRCAPLRGDGHGGPEDRGGLSPVCNRGRGDDPRSRGEDEPRCKDAASHGAAECRFGFIGLG
jgi:hypothetical protein